MLGYISPAFTSSSEPGQSGDISPWTKMKSFYFDDSLAPNETHYQIATFLNDHPIEEEDPDWEEVYIKCKSEEEYNEVLNKFFSAGENKFKIYAVTNNNTEIIVDADPRDNYRKFDEKNLVEEESL